MKIALVDENLLLIDSLKNLLSRIPGLSDIHTYISGKDFLRDVAIFAPELVILDQAMSGLEGQDLFDTSKGILPHTTKTIVFADAADATNIKQTIRKGANGLLSKSTTYDEFRECVEAVIAGTQFIGKAMKDTLINSVFSSEPLAIHLSPREKEVLQRVCGGNTIKEIAYDLKLSVHTVQYYHRSVMDKLKVKRTTDLIVYAMQHKLYIPESR